jgi:hypothetical protein
MAGFFMFIFPLTKSAMESFGFNLREERGDTAHELRLDHGLVLCDTFSKKME